jgi:flagellar hook-associated protein 1 FlgK
MSGIGLVLNIAKDALLSQQYAIDVASHNIANVSTEGYSRQTPIMEANDSAPYAGLVFGRGVSVQDITNVTNQFVEKRLQGSTSDLSMLTEKETYMNVLETIFNESSETSISSQFSEFWNALNDLNNNPSGIPERNILTEYGTILSKTFQEASDGLLKLNTELNNSIDDGVNKVNEILDQIAQTNRQILLVRITGSPNDLLDKRTSLVKELSEYIDVNTYQYDDGSLTVSTSKGFVLVNRNDSYKLEFDGGEIIWGSTSTPITEDVKGGKLGGWLDLRDETIPKYKADLDEMAKATIWEINKIHSQGVGLTGFTSLSGSYTAEDTAAAMGDPGIEFTDLFENERFNLRLYDASGAFVGEETISVDLNSANMLTDLAAAINGSGTIGTQVNATAADGVLNLGINTAFAGYTFTVANDSSYNLDHMDISEDTGYEGSGLDFADRITDGSFKLWQYDSAGAVVGETTIPIDADQTTMSDLLNTINSEAALNASITDGKLNIEVDSSNPTYSGYTFAFSDDSSNILAALGINTFFTASNARNMGINENILSDKNYIAAGKINSNIGFAVASSSNDPSTTGFITTSGNPAGYTGAADGTFNIRMTNGGTTFRYSRDAGPESGDIGIGNNILLEDGVRISFNGATFNDNDTFSIDVTASSDTYGDFFPGDNTNSLDLANLQYQNVTVRQWSYSREDGASFVDVSTATIDENLHQMIGSIGIESQSVQREKDYNQTMVDQISETRDNISGVSLDEEMANLIRFQHAYMAAAKLITTAQEMLDEILQAV